MDGLFLFGSVLAILWFWKIVLPNGGIYWLGHWSMVIAPLALGLPLSLMVFGLYRGSRIGRWLFANPVVYFLGLISYSLYLWHFVVLQQADLVFGDAFTDMQGFPKFLVSFLLVVLVSTVSYFLFERPFYRLGARRKPQDHDSAPS
jgi:peptidoglycan/LPS O-acetylase OafA/YrhL